MGMLVDELLGRGPGNVTFALIKPDAYPARSEAIRQLIQSKGINILAEREIQMDARSAAIFYYEHVGRDYFGANRDFIVSGPCLAMVLEGDGIVGRWRELMGATVSAKAAPDTIRGQWGDKDVIRRNCVHGSDNPVAAMREILLVFPEDGVPPVG